MGEDLLRYSNKIESDDLRQCPVIMSTKRIQAVSQ